MFEHPRAYASFHDVLDREIGVLKNDLGEKLTFTREAAGDIAIMLVEFCDDPDLAGFVGEQWTGHGHSLEEEAEESTELLDTPPRVSLDDLDDEDMTHAIGADRYHPDESRVDLGGGMVVPLAELMEDDDES